MSKNFFSNEEIDAVMDDGFSDAARQAARAAGKARVETVDMFGNTFKWDDKMKHMALMYAIVIEITITATVLSDGEKDATISYMDTVIKSLHSLKEGIREEP